MAGDDLDTMLASATQAQRSGRREEAAALFRAVIARHGEQPLALNGLGIQALGRRDFTAAADCFRRAIAADPRAPDLWMNLARAARESGDDTGERAALDGALAIDQRHFMALVRIAELLERTGEGEGAIDRWSGVLALAGGIEAPTPALEAMLEHARDRVTRHHAAFASNVDHHLAPALGQAEPGDRRRFQACIDHALGRRSIYANDCAGLHYPFLPADEYFDRAHFPWLAALEAQTATIRAEFEALAGGADSGLKPYVAMASGTPDNKWTPLDGSLAWGALHLWKDGRRDEAACARAPRTAAIIEALPLSDLPGRTPTIFFSVLEPGTHLPPHTGVSNVRTIIHLPLIVPEGCAFRVGGETRAWEEGKAWAFDDTIEHEAWNRSDRPRAILIFDVWNPHLSEAERALIRRFYTVADASGRAVDKALRIAD